MYWPSKRELTPLHIRQPVGEINLFRIPILVVLYTIECQHTSPLWSPFQPIAKHHLKSRFARGHNRTRHSIAYWFWKIPSHSTDVHMYIYIYIHTYIHTYVHIYIYTLYICIAIINMCLTLFPNHPVKTKGKDSSGWIWARKRVEHH